MEMNMVLVSAAPSYIACAQHPVLPFPVTFHRCYLHWCMQLHIIRSTWTGCFGCARASCKQHKTSAQSFNALNNIFRAKINMVSRRGHGSSVTIFEIIYLTIKAYLTKFRHQNQVLSFETKCHPGWEYYMIYSHADAHTSHTVHRKRRVPNMYSAAADLARPQFAKHTRVKA